jgi:hypothetical protein
VKIYMPLYFGLLTQVTTHIKPLALCRRSTRTSNCLGAVIAYE